MELPVPVPPDITVFALCAWRTLRIARGGLLMRVSVRTDDVDVALNYAAGDPTESDHR
jgi:hypothetical protein